MSSTDLLPADEVMIRIVREVDWRTENREGVPHFAPGQIYAEKAADDEGGTCSVLVYAPVDGHRLLGLICVNERGFWEQIPFAIEFRRHGQYPIKLPDTFMLSRGMVAALDEAATR